MDENLGYNIVTISDGTQYKVPKHLSKEEAFAAVGRVDPSALRISGIFETFDDKFDYSSGVLDSALRGRLAIAQTFEEKANVLNEKAGPNNWGFTDWSNEPFVTPQGYRNITGEEPPEGPFKNILIDATGTESWRDIIDIAPELFIGGASVASELLLPNVPGSGLVGRGAAAGLLRTVFNRGLSGRAVSAGTGDAVANAGLEIYQKYLGDQKETVGELAQRIGLEAGIVTGGTLVLGAPLKLAGPLAGQAGRVAGKFGIGGTSESARATKIARMLEAQERLGTKIGPDNVLPITIKTLAGDPETASLGPLSKLAEAAEGIGARLAGGATPLGQKAGNMLDAVLREYKSKGEVTKEFIDAHFDKQQRSALKTFGEAIEGKGKAAYRGKNLAAKELTDGTARGLRNFATQQLRSIYKSRMGGFEPRFAAFKAEAAGTSLSNQKVANLIDEAAIDMSKADIGLTREEAQDVLIGLLGKKGKRLYKKDGKVYGEKEVTKKGKKIIQEEAGFTVDDILSMDKKLRNASYLQAGAKNFSVARQNMKASQVINDRMKRLRMFNVGGFSKLQSEYAQAIRPFAGTGKNRGLFKVFEDDAGKGNIEQLIKGIIDGKESLHLANFLTDIEKAFDVTDLTEAAKNGIYTADEIIGHMGDILIREKALEIGAVARSATDVSTVKAEARRIIKNLTDLETEVRKKFSDKSRKGSRTWNKLFREGTVKRFKKDLAILSGGSDAAATRAAQRLMGIQSRAELKKVVSEVIKAADNPSSLRDMSRLYRNIKKRDPEGAQLISDMFQTETFTKLTALSRNADFNDLQKWGNDWANGLNDPATVKLLREMLGAKAYRDYSDLALVLKGGLDVDPNAGSIMFGALPLVIFGNLMKGNLKGVGKSMALMFTVKEFAPGSNAWKQLQAPLAAARRGNKKINTEPTAKLNSIFNKSLGKGQRLANLVAMGHSGYFAGGVSAMMDQMEQDSPPRSPEEFMARNRPPPEQPQIDPSIQADPRAMVNAMNAPPVVPSPAPPAPSPVTGLGQTGLNIGTNIAQGITR